MSNGQQTLTRVARSRTHGNGLFARASIRKGRTILRERVLVVRDPGPEFENYVFDWGRGRFGLVLGSTSLINHSSEPNAEVHTWDEHVTVVALREIRKGEEIFIDYGPNHPVVE